VTSGRLKRARLNRTSKSKLNRAGERKALQLHLARRALSRRSSPASTAGMSFSPDANVRYDYPPNPVPCFNAPALLEISVHAPWRFRWSGLFNQRLEHGTELSTSVGRGTNASCAQQSSSLVNKRIQPTAGEDHGTVGSGSFDVSQHLKAAFLGEAYGNHNYLGPRSEEKLQGLMTTL